jgi:hypothetical protein
MSELVEFPAANASAYESYEVETVADGGGEGSYLELSSLWTQRQRGVEMRRRATVQGAWV